LKFEAVVVLFVGVCVSLAFYFAFLSFCTLDDVLRKQFVGFAVYSLVAGIAVFASFLTYLVIRKALFRVDSVVETDDLSDDGQS